MRNRLAREARAAKQAAANSTRKPRGNGRAKGRRTETATPHPDGRPFVLDLRGL